MNLKDERQKMTDSRPPELVLESHAMLVKTSKIQLPQMTNETIKARLQNYRDMDSIAAIANVNFKQC